MVKPEIRLMTKGSHQLSKYFDRMGYGLTSRTGFGGRSELRFNSSTVLTILLVFLSSMFNNKRKTGMFIKLSVNAPFNSLFARTR